MGAVFEASRLDTPAIAFSAFPDGQEIAAKYFTEVYEYITKNNLFAETPLYNVNIPNEVKGIRMTYQGSQYFSDEFIQKDGDMYMQQGEPIPDVCPEDMDRDTVAILHGYITVTPLLATRTDMATFHKYKTK